MGGDQGGVRDPAWSVTPSHEMRGIGGPEGQPTPQEALKRDAAEGAKDYRKSGHSGRR